MPPKQLVTQDHSSTNKSFVILKCKDCLINKLNLSQTREKYLVRSQHLVREVIKIGFFNNILPLKTILDLFCPFYKFYLSQVLLDSIFPSGLSPSHWSTSICIFSLLYQSSSAEEEEDEEEEEEEEEVIKIMYTIK